MLFHVYDAVTQGYTKVSFRTVGTDGVVLAVAATERLSIYELWVAFCTAKSFRFFATREMARTLGPDKCRGLLAFMLSLGVIPCQALEAGAKILHGRRGTYVMGSV